MVLLVACKNGKDPQELLYNKTEARKIGGCSCVLRSQSMIIHTISRRRFHYEFRKRFLSLHKYKPCVLVSRFIYKSISHWVSSLPVGAFFTAFPRKQFRWHFHLPHRRASFIDKYSILAAANWLPVRHPRDALFLPTIAGKISKGLTVFATTGVATLLQLYLDRVLVNWIRIDPLLVILLGNRFYYF